MELCPGRLGSNDHAASSATACSNPDHFIISGVPFQEDALVLSNTQKITVEGSHLMETLKLCNCLFVTVSLSIVSFVDFETPQRNKGRFS